MTSLTDAAVSRLKKLGNWPELDSSRYVVLEEIGRGGMGTVYLARDEELGREVALKISNALERPDFDRRLQREARALARLEHPGIVPIHDAGRLADGRLFYVMKRIEGRTLREHIQGIADPVERLRVFERICEPVAFAHARGVIHRDLKPDNVMIGAFGEVIVMDWGLAKAVGPGTLGRLGGHDEHDAGDEGSIAGTRGFMAPEQARGAAGEIDHRADVYGLGAILYLLVSNDLPAPDKDPQSTLRRHGVPRALAAICAKALQVSPAHRYQTVAALGDDVARYRAGRAVEAYRETVVERVVRFGRTYRTAILLVLGYIIMRALVAVLAGW